DAEGDPLGEGGGLDDPPAGDLGGGHGADPAPGADGGDGDVGLGGGGGGVHRASFLVGLPDTPKATPWSVVLSTGWGVVFSARESPPLPLGEAGRFLLSGLKPCRRTP